MDESVEVGFVKTFVEERIQVRMISELADTEKRCKAIARFAHTTANYIKNKYICIRNAKLTEKEIINEISKHFDTKKDCYLMDEISGKRMPFYDALNICMNDFSPSIIICGEKVVFIKEEVSIGSPEKFILVKKT